MIVAICAVGAFTVNNAMIDLFFMIGFGFIGYVFKKLNYPLAPLVLALVLGRPGRELVPAGDARLRRQPLDLLVELAGWQHHGLEHDHAVLAADLEGDWLAQAPIQDAAGVSLSFHSASLLRPASPAGGANSFWLRPSKSLRFLRG